MDEVNAPLDISVQAQQPAAPQVQQPVNPGVVQPAAPQVQQPVNPGVAQPVTPQVQQPANEVQPGDIQQPTQATPVA